MHTSHTEAPPPQTSPWPNGFVTLASELDALRPPPPHLCCVWGCHNEGTCRRNSTRGPRMSANPAGSLRSAARATDVQSDAPVSTSMLRSTASRGPTERTYLSYNLLPAHKSARRGDRCPLHRADSSESLHPHGRSIGLCCVAAVPAGVVGAVVNNSHATVEAECNPAGLRHRR